VIEDDRMTVAFDDGSSTELTVMLSTEPDAPVVVCLPAMGVPAVYYEMLGDTLADAGFHAVLADLRGNGASSVRPSRRLPLFFSARITLHPAARNARRCTVRSWSSVETRA